MVYGEHNVLLTILLNTLLSKTFEEKLQAVTNEKSYSKLVGLRLKHKEEKKNSSDTFQVHNITQFFGQQTVKNLINNFVGLVFTF